MLSLLFKKGGLQLNSLHQTNRNFCSFTRGFIISLITVGNILDISTVKTSTYSFAPVLFHVSRISSITVINQRIKEIVSPWSVSLHTAPSGCLPNQISPPYCIKQGPSLFESKNSFLMLPLAQNSSGCPFFRQHFVAAILVSPLPSEERDMAFF